jgi:peptide/nickel transport system substrate-binding protein
MGLATSDPNSAKRMGTLSRPTDWSADPRLPDGAWSRRDFLRTIGRAAGLAALAAVPLDVTASCSTAGPGESTRTVSPRIGGHLTEGSPTDVSQLTPYLAADTASSMVAGLLFESLLSCKSNGELIPQLAADLPRTSADGLTYTFKLRKNLRWSDGTPLTSEDVLFTYSLHWDPKYRAVNSPRRQDFEAHVQSMAAPDPGTFVIKTTNVYAPFLVNMAGPGYSMGIVPKHVLGNVDARAINTHDFNRNPTVVNGVFRFVRWDPGQQILLARNDNYWAGRSRLDRYVYKVLPDQVTVATQLKTGEVDIGSIVESLVDDLSAHSDTLSVSQFDIPAFDFFAYQMDPSRPASRLFADKAVRQALLFALDRQQMVDALYFKHASVATGPIPPIQSWAYNRDAQPRYAHDKARAERMLDGVGWRKGASGIRERDGVPMRFQISTAAGSKVREGIVQVMQQQWAEIGVECTPALIQFPQLVKQITNLRTFDAFMIGFTFGLDPDQSSLWHSRSTSAGGFNGFMYRSPIVDKLLDDAVGTLDHEQRRRLYYQFQNVLNEDVPAPILTFRKGFWGINGRVRGVSVGDHGLGPYTQFNSRPWMKDVFVVDGA